MVSHFNVVNRSVERDLVQYHGFGHFVAMLAARLVHGPMHLQEAGVVDDLLAVLVVVLNVLVDGSGLDGQVNLGLVDLIVPVAYCMESLVGFYFD